MPEAVSGPSSSEEAQAAGPSDPTQKPKETPPSYSANDATGTLGDLKAKHPDLYRELIVNGWAWEMVNKMRKNQERLKKVMREGQRK